ncbi:PRC-barrel domain-containing protein [Clostridium sp. YIM B02505]|uniref:PRC-barrel domain-containing protein n=1 Tax=Clostridium yunnanense TaxID=2800325 RepID=A0ABS1EWT1_9CLOT|nr:PRC-barrel domain-containing protein [Clostridium yunnanense]MBK1813770.1 PRC-barrel domain-containing protein [Clostridium yunnanense]
MQRIKDFEYMNVYNIQGKKLGSIKELYIDFYNGKLKGFEVNRRGLKKENFIEINSIITVNKSLIFDNFSKSQGLPFCKIKGMDVVDKCGEIVGVVEDMVIDTSDYTVKGLIISSGFINKLIRGKNIILFNQMILGEKFILYYGSYNVLLKSMPHNFAKGDCYEET